MVKDLAKKKIVGRVFKVPAAVVPQAQQEHLVAMVLLEVTAVEVEVLLALACQAQVVMEPFQVAVAVVAVQALIVLILGLVVMAPLVTFASGAGNYGLRNP